MKTHRVNDTINGKIVFTGTYNECYDWKYQKGYGYKISELNPDEIIIANTYGVENLDFHKHAKQYLEEYFSGPGYSNQQDIINCMADFAELMITLSKLEKL